MLTNEQKKALIEAASQARLGAYAPYSEYLVGAALLTDTGRVYTGANIENAAYPTSMCAERVAIYKAVSEGQRQFLGIAVVTANGGPPCGACRQVMAEFSPEMEVLIATAEGNLLQETSVAALLPGAFGHSDLGR